MTYPSNTESVAQDQIRAFVERAERLEEEIKALNEDKKEIFAEARGNGFDVPALKQVIKLRRQDANERMEREAIVELYMSALGMVASPDFDEPPVQVQARARGANRADSQEPSTNLQKVQIAPTEPQSALQTGSDLAASPANDDGQVADNPVAKASEDDGATEQDIELSADSVTGDVSRLAAGRTADASGDEIPALNAEQQGGEQPESVTGGESAATSSVADKSVGVEAPAAPASLYAAFELGMVLA